MQPAVGHLNSPQIIATESTAQSWIKSALFFAPATAIGLMVDYSIDKETKKAMEDNYIARFFDTHISVGTACSFSVLILNIAFPEATYSPLIEAPNVYTSVAGALGAVGFGFASDDQVQNIPKKAFGGWCIGLGMNYFCPSILRLLFGSKSCDYNTSGALSRAVGACVVAFGISNIAAPTAWGRRLFGGVILFISASMFFPKSVRELFY